MNRKDYKHAMDQIEPEADLQNRIAQKLLRQKPTSPFRIKRVQYIMGSLLFVIIIGIIGLDMWKSANEPLIDVREPIEQVDPNEHIDDPNAITIPKIKLPDKSDAMADMIGLIVYKGNIYTQTSTHISAENATELRGDKLGRTKAGIDEWSEQTDYVELASTIGVADIFSVNGYDSDFRIMSYQVHEGQIYAELYEHLNGITIANGEDLIGKTKVKDNMETVRWQDYNNWYYSKPQFHTLPLNQTLHTFMAALYEAKPMDGEKLYKEGIYDDGAQNQKVLFFKLKDQTEVQMWLFKGNYVKYANAPVFFQLEPAAFSALWDSL
ncbi:hypothetical protein [Bacillus sp. FJAT-28004]|uniref:hypothetical protein n=1 Tax=Bacillus sp. FJAT-28004 TaxID=1679165 RepID=UPI0006B653FB|nr:hypothetical protein [Bacillus sp. FJAT-28004]